ncbi:MAG: hypothetical protein JNJ44_05195 [Zoogloeaceae bacterium]|nr:hypothetical protein [Zoogloeaceae bacterium]
MGLLAGVAAAASPAPGVSLFQQVFSAPDGRLDVPFPFQRLMKRLEGTLVSDGEALRNGLPLVVIPLGRSLQRHAAEEDGYFTYPRVVLAVTGEPRPGAPLLKDRLYIGYHERLAVLEVISFNETTGQFEFELVRDYRPGGKPVLTRARRELCLACHHGATPIFSRQTWDETAANPGVAKLLSEHLSPNLRPLPWKGGVDVPNAIDDATERSNRIVLAQRLWGEGCGADRDSGAACRSELLVLALMRRLTVGEFDTVATAGNATSGDPLAPLLLRWPGGLPLPNPDLPNRLPLASLDRASQEHPSATQLRHVADVPAAFDALALRSPRGAWSGYDAGGRAMAAAAVGLTFTKSDLKALDQGLAIAPAPIRDVEGEGCQIAASSADQAGRQREFSCRRPALRGAVSGRGRSVRGRVEDWALAGQSQGPVELRGETRQGVMQLVGRDRRLVGLEIVPGAEGQARIQLRLRDEAALLRQVAQDLAREGGVASPVLARRTLVPSLLRVLGSESRSPCCSEMAGLTLPEQEAPGPLPPGGVGEEVGLLYRICGACHDGAEAFPPGFLHGEVEAVGRQVQTCAPRIIFRLSMARLPPSQRPKTPMPPPFSQFGSDFAERPEFARLIAWLETQAGRSSSALLQQPYADLPACRPTFH